MKKLKRQNSLFLQCKISSVVQHGKLGKLKCELLKIFKYYTLSRGYHVKADYPRIPKMWYFLGLAVFKVELLAPEVGSNFKKKNDGNAVSKKKSRPQFLKIPKIVAVTFFLDTS